MPNDNVCELVPNVGESTTHKYKFYRFGTSNELFLERSMLRMKRIKNNLVDKSLEF